MVAPGGLSETRSIATHTIAGISEISVHFM